MSTKESREIMEVMNAQGGTGILKKEPLLTLEQLGKYCELFAEIKLPQGASLGYHEHHGEVEVYYILSGEGVYNQNGKKINVTVGDVLFCEDGEGHALENSGLTDLVWIALILKK